MANITIYLNDKEITVESGKTILAAAAEHGVEIPTLCHDERLQPFGSCFVCVVDVEGARNFQPACATRVAPGMRIKTHSEQLHSVRRMALELLLSNHFADCKAPCVLTCPANVDVQGYIAHIANKRYREALALVKETNPFPLSIGRVCTRPCEGKCRRGVFEDPVGIDYLKRFVADLDLQSGDPYLPAVKNSHPEKVAVIGSGPGGLSAAYYLAVEGYTCVVFEKLPRPGGMFRYGIPEYRLPKSVLDAEIEIITRLGIEIRCGQELGKDFSIQDLRAQGFSAVLLAPGAQKGIPMKIKGEDLPGVLIGVDFLREVTLGSVTSIGRRVAVVGGGNTAMDAARTSLRLGAEKVMIIYRRTRQEMPANDVEIEEAMEEGIEFHFLVAPVEIRGSGKAEKLVCVRMTLGEPDESGRRRPVPQAGSEYELDVDCVIAAVGQAVDASLVRLEPQPPGISKWGTLVADEGTTTTSLPGVFAIGDAVTGPKAAIDAIAGGGRAARAVHHYLRHGEVRPVDFEFNIRKEDFRALTADDFAEYERTTRQKMAVLEPAERKTNFHEIEQGFSEEQAQAEAARCLECGCKDVFECKLKKYGTEYRVDVARFKGGYKELPVDEHHPFIRIEPTKCINCGRCVRICAEVQEIHAWGFVKRGFEAMVRPTFEKPLLQTDCESCGQCVQSCPVGALTEKNPQQVKPGPFRETTVEAVCSYCSVGCGQEIRLQGGDIGRITGRASAPVNAGNLCRRGRYGFGVLQDDARLTTPLLRRDGRLEPITMAEARRIVGEKVGQARHPRLVLGEALPQEVFYHLPSLPFPAFSFAQEEYRPLLDALNRAGLTAHIGAEAAEFDAAAIVVVESQFQESHPVLLLNVIRQLKNGRKVFYIGRNLDAKLRKYTASGKVRWFHKYEELADVFAAYNPRLIACYGKDQTAVREYREVLRAFEGKQSVAAELFLDEIVRQEKLVFLLGGMGYPAVPHFVNFLALLDRPLADLRVVVAGPRSNSGGWMLQHNFHLNLPNLQRPCDVLITLRQDPLGTVSAGREAVAAFYGKASFRITADCFLSETARASDLVIPVHAAAELFGTSFNCLLQQQTSHKAVKCGFGITPLVFLHDIMDACGVESDRAYQDIFERVEKLTHYRRENGRRAFLAVAAPPEAESGLRFSAGADVLETMTVARIAAHGVATQGG